MHRLMKPSPKRPTSGMNTGRSSMNTSRTLSLDNMNTLDSSSIRDVMYETWRAEKTVELKKKKRLEKKKIEEAEKQKKKVNL